MDIESQNVLDSHGNNAIFMVWNFEKDLDVKDAFKRICALVINLNNSADIRFSRFRSKLRDGDRV
jgi:putative iron-dependent peroxidase